HAMPGRPGILRLRDVARGARHAGATAVEDPQEHALSLRAATGRWLLPESHLSIRAGPQAPDQRDYLAGDRVPPGGRGRRRTDLSPGYQRARRAASSRSGTGSAVSRTLGD